MDLLFIMLDFDGLLLVAHDCDAGEIFASLEVVFAVLSESGCFFSVGIADGLVQELSVELLT